MSEQKETTIDDFTFDAANARHHDEKNLKAIGNSFNQFGAGRSILVDAENVIRAGNGTAEAWQAAGGKVRIVESDGTELIAVKRTDLKGTKAIAYAIADNRASELGRWDNEVLVSQLDSLAESGVDLQSLGFTEIDLARLSPDEASPESFGEVDEDIDCEYCCPKCKYVWSGSPS